MNFNTILKLLGIRKKSLAENVHKLMIDGYEPSSMAKEVVGDISPSQFNEMMNHAKETYNSEHDDKVLVNE